MMCRTIRKLSRYFPEYLIPLILVTIPAISSAEVTFEVGAKLEGSLLEEGYRKDSVMLNQSAYYEPYVGADVEFLCSPLRNLYLRGDVASLRFFTDTFFGLGRSLNILSDLSTDLIYVVPLGSRIRPLVFAGLRYEQFFGKPLNDLRAWFPSYEVRAGLGATYSLTRKATLFVEVQLLSMYEYYELDPFLPDVLHAQQVAGLGVPRAWLGIRYRL